MYVLAGHLCLVVVCLMGINRVRVVVQLQQKRVRHHGSHKEQQQNQGDMMQVAVHVQVVNHCKYSINHTTLYLTGANRSAARKYGATMAVRSMRPHAVSTI